VGPDAWLTLIVIVLTMVLLATERVAASAVILGAVVVLLLAGVIDEGQAFSGFGNPAVITVAALYVLAGAAEATGALERFSDRAMGRGPAGSLRLRRQLARVTVPTAAASAFIPNTPLVTMLAPRVVMWARRVGTSPSPYLMPLSYASIFGGIVTVLGTSTNLVVSGLLEASGQAPLGVFEITPVGLPIALVGVGAMLLLAPRLIGARVSPSDQVRRRAREYTVEMRVVDGGPLVGQSVAEAGLRHLEGVFLVGIERDGHAVAPVAPDEVLAGGDHLTFTGNVARVVDLQRQVGLESAEQAHLSVIGDAPGGRLFEAVVSEGSALSGSTLRDSEFRSRYGGAVFAVHRDGERLAGKLGQVRLRGGDVLVMLADPGFRDRWRDSPDFLIVSALGETAPPRRHRARLVEIVMIAMVVAASTNLLSLPRAALAAAMALVLLRVLTPAEARQSLSFEILVMIAASFGLGAAMAESGLAAELSSLLVGLVGALGPTGVLLGVLLATIVATETLTNNAAAVLMFPIAMSAAEQSGVEPRALAVAILVAASCSFLTPIGYQTNTIVYGLGGYRFGDFSRLGLPLTVLTVAVSMVVIPIAFPL
jgi:di/tricarboxylate transporter